MRKIIHLYLAVGLSALAFGLTLGLAQLLSGHATVLIQTAAAASVAAETPPVPSASSAARIGPQSNTPRAPGRWTPTGGPLVPYAGVEDLAVGYRYDADRMLLPTTTLYALGGIVGSGDNTRVYRSTDGGDNWTEVFYADGDWLDALAVSTIYTSTGGGRFLPQIIYAGGPWHAIYKSTNGGDTWTEVSLNPDPDYGRTIHTLATGPFTSSVVYAGGREWQHTIDATKWGVVYRSQDQGTTWTRVLTTPAVSDEGEFNTIAIHPDTPAIAYAAGGENRPDGTDILFYSVIYKTEDGGETWNRVYSGTHPEFAALVLHPLTPTTVYAGNYPDRENPSYVFRSENSGVTWTKVFTDAGEQLALAPPNTLYATNGQRSEVFSSTLGGNPDTWHKTNTPDKWIDALTVDLASPDDLYAGTKDRGIFKSTDRAQTWEAQNNGLQATVRPYDIDVDPQNPDKLFIAAESGGGGWMTTDGGQTYTRALDMFNYVMAFAINPYDPDIVYGGIPNNGGPTVWRSEDDGLSFTPVYTANCVLSGGDEAIHDLAIVPLMTSTIYAAGSDYKPGWEDNRAVILRSLNGGVSWTEVFTLPSGTNITVLAPDPADTDTVYAGGDNWNAGPFQGFIYRTTDNGATWDLVLTTSWGIRSIVITPQRQNILYAATNNADIYQSTDGGDTWETIHTCCPSGDQLAINAHIPSHVYLGGHGYIAESRDSGQTWSTWDDPLNRGTPDMPLGGLTVINDTVTQTFYAGFNGLWTYRRPAPQPVNLNNVAITGPTDVMLNTPYTITAVVSPLSATLPITYLWHMGQTVSLSHISGLTDTAVLSWTTPGTHTITVTARNMSSEVSTPHTVTIIPRLSLVKTVDTGDVDAVPLESVVTYTLVLNNSGTAPATGVVITDPLPALVTPLAATITGTAYLPLPDNVLRWGPFDLAIGARITLRITAIVTNDLAYHGATVTNRARFISDNARSGEDRVSFTIAEDFIPPGPVTGVTVYGPTEGYINTTYRFTTAIRPDTAATPIRYTWTPAPVSGQGTSRARYVWTSAGSKTLTVVAQNESTTGAQAAAVTDTHTVTIEFPPTLCPTPLDSITLLGPSEGYTGTVYAFTAVISPAMATLPFTYTWDSGHWSPGNATSSNADTFTYTWSTVGRYPITVTVTNCGASVVATETIAVQPRPAPTTGDAYEADDTCLEADDKPRIPTDGTLQQHTFHAYGDEDWTAFEARSGITYAVTARIPPPFAADVVLEIYDACSQTSGDEHAPAFSPEVRILFTPPTTGTYYLRIRNASPAVYGTDVAYDLSVRALSRRSQGALIVVGGKLKPDDPLQSHIHGVTASVYRFARTHGCTADQIYYLASDPTLPNVDTTATNATLKSAITEWAADRVGPDYPLTLFMMDHGDSEGLYLDGYDEKVTPTALNDWLTELGADVSVVIEACHAGSFIDIPQSISQDGRVIIASTRGDALAYASQSGAMFSDAFLAALQNGLTMQEAFQEAAWKVEAAHPSQIPQLDDNGNAIPNDTQDGKVAAQRGFACTEAKPAQQFPPYIVWSAVKRLRVDKERGEIWAEVRDDREVKQVWASVYHPSYRPQQLGNEIVPEPVLRFQLTDQGHDLYGKLYRAFDEIGVYRVVVLAEDAEGLPGQPKAIRIAVGGTPVYPEEALNTLAMPIAGYTTTLEIPGSAITHTLTLVPTIFTTVTSAPTGYTFAERGLDIKAYQWGRQQPGFAFQHPVTFTVHYSNADITGLDESTLALFWLDGTTWRTTGLTVSQRLTAANQLVIQAAHLTKFALFGRFHSLYLPLVLRK